MAFLIDRICPAVPTRLAAVPDRVSAFSSNAATSSVVAVSNAKDATSVVPVPAAPLFCTETVTVSVADAVIAVAGTSLTAVTLYRLDAGHVHAGHSSAVAAVDHDVGVGTSTKSVPSRSFLNVMAGFSLPPP